MLLQINVYLWTMSKHINPAYTASLETFWSGYTLLAKYLESNCQILNVRGKQDLYGCLNCVLEGEG